MRVYEAKDKQIKKGENGRTNNYRNLKEYKYEIHNITTWNYLFHRLNL